MRVIFAGTPAFAASTLQALIESSHTVELVLTQPDRPSGRGMRLQPSPVKQLALAHGLAVAQPMGLRLDGRYADDAQSTPAGDRCLSCGRDGGSGLRPDIASMGIRRPPFWAV